MNTQQQLNYLKIIRQLFVYGDYSSRDGTVLGGNDNDIIEQKTCNIHFINLSNQNYSKIIESDSHEFFGVLTYYYLSSLQEKNQNIKFYLNNEEININCPLELYKLGLKDGSKILVESY